MAHWLGDFLQTALAWASSDLIVLTVPVAKAALDLSGNNCVIGSHRVKERDEGPECLPSICVLCISLIVACEGLKRDMLVHFALSMIAFLLISLAGMSWNTFSPSCWNVQVSSCLSWKQMWTLVLSESNAFFLERSTRGFSASYTYMCAAIDYYTEQDLDIMVCRHSKPWSSLLQACKFLWPRLWHTLH